LKPIGSVGLIITERYLRDSIKRKRRKARAAAAAAAAAAVSDHDKCGGGDGAITRTYKKQSLPAKDSIRFDIALPFP
jgi:hypothetical protein